MCCLMIQCSHCKRSMNYWGFVATKSHKRPLSKALCPECVFGYTGMFEEPPEESDMLYTEEQELMDSYPPF